MAFKVVPTEDFTKSFKQISKKHKGIIADLFTCDWPIFLYLDLTLMFSKI